MEAPTKIVYETSREDLKSAIREVMQNEIEGKVLDRFFNVIIDSNGASQILGISKSTLHRWCSLGVLEPEPRERENQSLRFRLSYLLKLNTTEIKKKVRYEY